MIHTENDCLEITKKIIDKQKDLRASVFRYHSHKITYNSDGFPLSHFETQSFIVDWQLSIEEISNADKLWY